MDNKELYNTIKDAEDEGYKEGKKVALAEVMSVLDEHIGTARSVRDEAMEILTGKICECEVYSISERIEHLELIREEIKRRLEGVK